MRLKIMKMFAYLAIVLMVVSILPAVALANEGNGAPDNPGTNSKNVNDDNETQKNIRATIQSDAAKYMTSKERMVTVRNDYSDAKKDFQELSIKINNKNISVNSDEAINTTRIYMNSTIDLMILNLVEINETLNNSGGYSTEISKKINEYIGQLKRQKEDVGLAETRQEFAKIANEVRSIWKDAEKYAKTLAVKSVDNRLDNYFAKSDALALRIGIEIGQLNKTGVDVTKLEELLGQYNESIIQAKENQTLAKEDIRNGNGDDASVYMRNATKNIQDANKVLKEIFDELKSHRRGGLVSLGGAGTLTTEGNGTAVFSGNLNITINATNAKLVIKDLAGDAEINITDVYTLVNDDDDDENEEDDDNNRAFVYHNFTGTVNITGSRLTVMVNGENLSITAEGDGSSILSGRGSYNVEKAGKSSEKMMWAGNDVEESDDEDVSDDDENETDDDDENETEDDETMGDD